MAVHPNSLANLKPVKPGEIRNPEGRKTAGASIKEWVNAFAEWTVSEVKKVVDSPDATVAQLAAARTVLGSIVDGEDFDRICDRTEGKPNQFNHLTSDGTFRDEPIVLVKPVDIGGKADGS